MDRNNKAYERMSTYLVTKGIPDLPPPIDVVSFLCATRLMFRIPKADLDKYTSLRKFLNNIAPCMGLKLLQEHTIMFMAGTSTSHAPGQDHARVPGRVVGPQRAQDF